MKKCQQGFDCCDRTKWEGQQFYAHQQRHLFRVAAIRIRKRPSSYHFRRVPLFLISFCPAVYGGRQPYIYSWINVSTASSIIAIDQCRRLIFTRIIVLANRPRRRKRSLFDQSRRRRLRTFYATTWRIMLEGRRTDQGAGSGRTKSDGLLNWRRASGLLTPNIGLHIYEIYRSTDLSKYPSKYPSKYECTLEPFFYWTFDFNLRLNLRF